MNSIIFDTNVLRKILENENAYRDIMKKLQDRYEFKISSFTFVEIVRQIIKNENDVEQLMNLFVSYKINCIEFENYKLIEDPKFTYDKFKLMKYDNRIRYFDSINNRNNEFICMFFALFLEFILYALVILLDNEHNSNESEIDYLKYINENFENFKNKFLDVYSNGNKIRIKNQFNILLYEELKKIKSEQFDINKEKLSIILEQFRDNKENLTEVFKYHDNEAENIKKKFFNIYYENGIQYFFKSYTSIFQEYIKSLLNKIIIKGGKVDENDIVDCLILNTVKSKEEILLTNDEKIRSFLQEKNMWHEDIFKKFFL